MSVNGLQQPYVNNSLDGLVYVEVDGLTINGIPVDPTTFIPYTGATKPVSLGPFSLETLTSLSARQVNLTTFTSTMMTGPTTSSLFTADAWQMSNTIQISSLGGSAFASTSYLHIRDTTNSSTLLTLQSDGVADFGTSIPRASTLATSNYDLVNLSTLSNAIAYLEGITSLNFVPYVGSLNNLEMGGSTITTTGLMSAGALRITSSVSNVDYSLSVNGTDFLEFANLLTNQKVVTDGDSMWIPNRIFCNSTIYTSDLQMGSAIYFAYGTGQQWGTLLNGSGEYVIQDDLGATRLKLSKTTGLTISTLNVTAVPSATPTLALGVNGGGQVVSFAVPSAGGTVNTSTTTARFLPYLSTATTLTNSLLNQIDNDSMGFGYTSIPSYPLGSGGKNMYVNGSIFAGALNSMYATFGRDTNTSNPANEITFTANGAGVLVSQIKSHSGASGFVDATWTYSNTNPAPLGANQGQVLLTAKNLNVSGIGNIRAGNPFAVPNGYMQTGSLTIGDCSLNYGGGTTLWSSNTAGLLMECLDRTEIAVHDAGARVTSMMFYDGSTNTFTMGRDMGWGVSNVIASNNLTANCFIVNGGGSYVPGCIYSDGNWGMLFRAKVVPAQGIFAWYDSAGGERMKMLPNGTLQLTTGTSSPGFVHTDGTVIVETWIGGGGGWYGTRTNHPLRFYTNNSSARMTLNTGGDMTHTAGDSSYMKYGPNSTWNSFLVVGASPDRAGPGVAQVVATNSNLHLDAGNSNAIYYGYYANSRGTPNPHYFYGGDYQFIGVPQNEYPYAHVACFFGDRLRRSQCMMRQVYKNDYISWGGGIQMADSFYKYNAIAPVKISGKYSGYVASGGVLATMVVRVYSQSSGVYRYYPFITYQNLAYVQTTYPFELILSSAMIPETGWFDIYIYSSFALVTDINNQLHVNVQLLPVDAF